MKTFLKILAIVLGIVVVLSCIEFIFLFNLEFPIYKNLHVEAKRGYDEVGAYLEYEKSKYYRLQDVSPLYIDKDVLYKDPRWYWDFEHPYCYSDEDFNHAEKLYFKSEAENKALNFFIKFFLNSRFYRFYNDPETNFLYEPNESFFGPATGWLYVKANYEFPTVGKVSVRSICVGEDRGVLWEGLTVLDIENYPQILNCIQNHEDFSMYFPEEYRNDWGALYVQYENCPLTECIATNDNGNILWELGGTP